MKIFMYFFAIIGVIASISLIYFILKRFFEIKKIRNGEPKVFDDVTDLMQFIRINFECKKVHGIALFGFVVDCFYDDSLVKHGIEKEPHLSVDVSLIAPQGHTTIQSVCISLNANLKKGDFVAVLPLHNTRHDIWTFTLVSKLQPIFLGGEKGFLIKEQYI